MIGFSNQLQTLIPYLCIHIYLLLQPLLFVLNFHRDELRFWRLDCFYFFVKLGLQLAEGVRLERNRVLVHRLRLQEVAPLLILG